MAFCACVDVLHSAAMPAMAPAPNCRLSSLIIVAPPFVFLFRSLLVRRSGLTGLDQGRERLDREHITVRAEARAHAGDAVRDQRFLVHRLTPVDVGDVDLDLR